MRVFETVATSGLIVLLYLATGVVSGRMLGPEGRGELASILLGHQMFGLLAVLGLPTAVIYYSKQNPSRIRALVGSTFLLSLIFGVISVALTLWLIPYWLSDYRPEVVVAAQIAMCLTPLLNLATVVSPVMRAKDEFEIFNAVRILTPLLTLVCLLAIWVVGIASPFTVAVPYVLSTLILMTWPLIWIVRNIKPHLRGWSSASRDLLHYCARSSVVDVVNAASQFLDRLVIIGMLDPLQAGLYVVAVSMARPLYEVGMAITMVLLPEASACERNQAIGLCGLAGRVGLWCMASLAGVLMLIAPYLLGVLFGPEFLPSVAPFRAILLSVLLSATGNILSHAFLATGSPGTVSVLRALEAILLFALLFTLIPVQGMMGAAWAMVAAGLFRLIAVMISFPVVLKVSPPRLHLTISDLQMVRSVRRRSSST